MTTSECPNRAENIWLPSPSRQPLLNESDVHIWRARLNVSELARQRFAAVLSEDEMTRATSFHFELHRNNFIAARGWLRTILGSYLNLAPGDVRFIYSSFGKPSIEQVTPIHFNLAHSGEYAVYAFTLNEEIGVDVEFIQRDFAMETIANQFFSPNEVASLFRFPQRLRPRAFYDCWTRKEAFIKAQGLGLSLPLVDFEVSLDHDEPALLHTSWDSAEATRWSLININVAADYAGAVAIARGERCLYSWHVDETS